MRIGKRKIGEGEKTFIIAEIGINHGGDLKLARELIKKASYCGADAVKMQTYLTEKRVSKNNPIYELLKKCELGTEEHQELFEVAAGEGIILFSTPFDDESVDLLVKFGVKAIKIASFDIVNFELLRKVVQTKIPLIVSTGMANKGEVDKAVELFAGNNTKYCLLHCISAYPTKKEDANLNVIKTLKKNYDCPIGYSDHTLGIKVPILAVSAGAAIIEKHFTLDKNLQGPDHQMSADPEDLVKMISEIREVEKILGSKEIRTTEAEEKFTSLKRITE